MKPGSVVGGRFEIEELAGTGGMARVYRAKDLTAGGVVAIKILHEESAQYAARFVRESQVLARLTHPAIVRYVAHGTLDGDRLFLAMEWLEGETLGDRLKTSNLTASEAVEIACRVAEGLGAAHAAGTVHRDIKPSNLFLAKGSELRVKVLDFGIAHIGREATHAMTRTGAMLGTPGYMAPEQARGDRDVDARADVFSLGCVLFECLTGRPPFSGETFMAVLAKILLEPVPRVRDREPDIAATLDDLVARMLSKSPSERPRDGHAVAAELDALGDVGSSMPASRSAAEPSSLTIGEQRLLSIVLAGAESTAPIAESTALMPTIEQSGSTLDDLRALALRHGGTFERFMGGSLVATFMSRGAATDQVAQAARCAIAIRAALPEAPIAVATGRGVMASAWPVGEVIDRAAAMIRDLGDAGRGSIRVDDTTAGLLGARFELGGDARGLSLVAEREGDDSTRTLLGRTVPCVGRERELGDLEQVLDECLDEPVARVVLVTAPPGVGKSRLRYEFVRKLMYRVEPRVEVWVGRGDPMSAGSAFGLLGQAIRYAAGIRAGEPLDVRRRKLRARVARNVRGPDAARIGEFLGELVGAPASGDGPPDSSPMSLQLRAAREDPRLMGDQMRRAFEDFIAAECAAQPVVLVLEDLHWGDLPTVQLVDAALRHAADLPFFVLALGRPEVRNLFPKLWDDRGLVLVLLRELKKSSAEKLVREVLGDSASDAVVQRLVERAAGNALYLEELVRAVAEGRGTELPETVLAMVEVRLASLEPAARHVLRAASIFGEVFWSRGVAALLGGSERTSTASEWIAELASREIVQTRRDGRFPDEPEFVFRHALVREAAYAMLTEDDRRLGHRLAGHWLRAAGETDPVVLAEHFERGGANEEAVLAFHSAALQALEGNDLRAAILRAERGIASGASGTRLGELRLVIAEAFSWRAEHQQSLANALEAMSLLDAGTAAYFNAAAIAAATAGRVSDEERLVALAEQLIAATPVPEARAALTSAVAHTIAPLLVQGRYPLADALGALIEQVEVELGGSDAVATAWIKNARSWRLWISGDLAAALSLDLEIATCFEAIGDLRRACEHRINVAYDMMNLGAYDQAEAALRDAIGLADRMELPGIAATARHNLGYALGRRGAFDEAIKVERAAVASCAAHGDRRMEGAALFYLAMILQGAGDLDDAEAAARQSVELLEVAPPFKIQAAGVLARILLAKGAFAEALATATHANGALERAGGIGEGESLVRLAFVEALLAVGKLDEAKRAAARARDRLLEMAAKIGDAVWRESFLTRIPENARILELASG